MKVYLLSRRAPDLGPAGGEVVAIFTTAEKARQAISAFRRDWGFPVSPQLFEIDAYELDQAGTAAPPRLLPNTYPRSRDTMKNQYPTPMVSRAQRGTSGSGDT